MTPIVVVHANHPAEIVGDCRDALRLLVTSGLTVLNQTVLLAGHQRCGRTAGRAQLAADQRWA